MESGTNSLNVDISKFLAAGLSADKIKEARRNIEKKCSDPILLKMLEDDLHADIRFKAGGGSVQAHRTVLASVSPVFDAMIKHHMKEQLTSTVGIQDMSIDGLQLFLLLLYTTNGSRGAISEFEAAVDKHFDEFYEALHKYQVKTRLKSVLLNSLPRNLTPDNCWDYYDWSKASLLEDAISVICHEYILHNFKKVQFRKCYTGDGAISGTSTEIYDIGYIIQVGIYIGP